MVLYYYHAHRREGTLCSKAAPRYMWANEYQQDQQARAHIILIYDDMIQLSIAHG